MAGCGEAGLWWGLGSEKELGLALHHPAAHVLGGWGAAGFRGGPAGYASALVECSRAEAIVSVDADLVQHRLHLGDR